MRSGSLRDAARWMREDLPAQVAKAGLEWHHLLGEEGLVLAEARSPVGATRQFKRGHRLTVDRPAPFGAGPSRSVRGQLKLGKTSFVSNVAFHAPIILKGRHFRQSPHYRRGRYFGSKQATRPLYRVVGRILVRRAAALFRQAVRRVT